MHVSLPKYIWLHNCFIAISKFPNFFVQGTNDINIFHINKYNFQFFWNCSYFFFKHKFVFQVYSFTFFPSLLSCIHMVCFTQHTFCISEYTMFTSSITSKYTTNIYKLVLAHSLYACVSRVWIL